MRKKRKKKKGFAQSFADLCGTKPSYHEGGGEADDRQHDAVLEQFL
jgi:hypothetical protein